MILCHIWIRSVQLTYQPDQEFILGSKGGAIQPDPLPSRRPEDLTKKVLPASLPNPSFIHQLWPGLLKKDATNNIKHTHLN